MATLAVTNDFSAGAAIVASEMNANFTDIETFVNTTPGVLQLTGGTVTGAVTLSNTLTVGADDTGYDVKFFGATSGSYMLWDEDQDELTFIASGIGLDDNSTLELGNDNDLIIKSNNAHSFIDHNGAGGLYIRTLGTDEDIFIDAKDTLQLHTDGSAALIVEADRNITVGDSSVLAYTSFEPTLQVRAPVHIKTWYGTAGSPTEGED